MTVKQRLQEIIINNKDNARKDERTYVLQVAEHMHDESIKAAQKGFTSISETLPNRKFIYLDISDMTKIFKDLFCGCEVKVYRDSGYDIRIWISWK